MTIRGKLILTFLLVSLVPLALLGVSGTLVMRRALEDAARHSLHAAAAQTASRVDAFITANLGAIRTEAQIPEFATFLAAAPAEQALRSPLQRSVLDMLNALSRKDPIYVRSYALLDRDGRNLLDTYSPFVGNDESAYAYFTQSMADSVPTSSSLLFPQFLKGEGGLFFSCVIRNRAYEPLGVLRVTYRAAVLQWLVNQSAPTGNGEAFAALLGEHGTYLAHSGRPSRVLSPADELPRELQRRLPGARPERETGREVPDPGVPAAASPFFSFALVGEPEGPTHFSAASSDVQWHPWIALQARPTATFLAPVQRHTSDTAALALVLAGAVILVAGLVSKLLSRPISQLTEMAGRLAAGDLSAQVRVTATGEIGVLGRTFNSMSERVRGLVKHLEDNVAKLQEAGAALRESEERYRSLVENTQDAYFMAELPSGRLLFVNHRACTLFGYRHQALLELSLWDLIAADQHNGLRECLENCDECGSIRPNCWTYHALRADGTTFLGEIAAAGVTYGGRSVLQGLLRDVTEQERLRDRLQQSQKLEAVGTLASGIAHDFNNILQVITSYVEALLRDPARSLVDRERLATVERTAGRAADLVRRLLAFSRSEEPTLRPLDLNREVVQGVELLAHTIPKMIRIETDLAADLHTIHGDPTQLEQILLNLVTNARDAMPEGGSIRISTQNVSPPPSGPGSVEGLEAGKYALLCVADSGQGMESATLEHIFEPFFSTKPVGKGTGLGLAMVYGIVMGHRGYIACHSEPGRGTTFHIYFPACQGPTAQTTVAILPAAAPVTRTGATILVVDDEPDVREAAQDILQELGYTTLTAASGEAALDICRAQRVALVVLDLGMPGMGGLNCLRELRRLDPTPHVLVASGYAGDRETVILRSHAAEFIQKPYRLGELVERVAARLASAPPRAPAAATTQRL